MCGHELRVACVCAGKLPAGAVRKYTSSLGAYRSIAQQEGVRALWTGVVPNMMRNSVMNAAELATYDQIKEAILETKLLPDGIPTQLASSLSAGFVAVCIGSPVDVVKSRMMGAAGAFSGPIDCIVQTVSAYLQ
jgi:solute carrier family 25 uncoupling protein 8/9